jgi:hypothetical protein
VARVHSSLIVLCTAATALLSGACERHLRLEAPDTSAGPRYTCHSRQPCEPATTDVPSQQNPSGTTFVVLPKQCRGRFHRIVIFDSGSDKPKVDVTCAPDDEPIKEME